MNNNNTSKEIYHFVLTIIEQKPFKKKLDSNNMQVRFPQYLCDWRFHYEVHLTQRIENYLSQIF